VPRHRPLLRAASVCLMVTCVGGCWPPIGIEPDTLPNGIEGRSYQQDLNSSIQAPLRWSIASRALPQGLSLDSAGGTISGVPVQTGVFGFTVSVADIFPIGRRGERAYSLTIIPRLTVDANLPAGRMGEEYNHSFSPAGGVPPYAARLVGLPAGLSFNPDAVAIAGTPVVARPTPYPLQLTLADSGDPNQTLVRQLQLRIKPPAVQITTSSLPGAARSVAYNAQLAATGGFTPYLWSIIAGVLPDGLSITNRQTGAISGTPSKVGTFTFTVLVEDSDSPTRGTDSRELSITVQ
jgi:hypothetical protein